MPPGLVPFPFGHCRICNDQATGIHYGLATCEGCKGFFKRSIPKGDKYKCFFGGQCSITPQNRNRCKSCRYRKCLELGMSFEAIKMGRIPKVEKQKALNTAMQKDDGPQNFAQREEEKDEEMMPWQPKCAASGNIESEHQFLQHQSDSKGSRSFMNQQGFTPHHSSMFASHYSQLPEGQNVPQGFNDNDIIPQCSKEVPQGYDAAGTSNISLLAEAALYPQASRPSLDDTASTDTTDSCSSSRSHYSQDVMKVLFDQVIEMTGSKKMPDSVIQKLSMKCSSFDRNEVLRQLSSGAYIEEALQPSFDNHQESMTWSQSSASASNTNSFSGNTWTNGQFSATRPEPQKIFSMEVDPSDDDYKMNGVDTQDNHSMFTATSGRNMHNPHHPCVPQPINNGYDLSNGGSIGASSHIQPVSNKTTTHQVWADNQKQSGDNSWMAGDAPNKERSGDGERNGDGGKNQEDVFHDIIQGLEADMDTHHVELRKMSTFVKDFISKGIPYPEDVINEEMIKETWNLLFESVHITNERIIGFCSAVPGFDKLDVDDQKVLTKEAYYNIWMLTSSEFFQNGRSYLRFLNGRFYSRAWMEYIIKEENTKLLFSFAESFNKLNLSELEVAILSAIELTSPGHDDADDVELKNSAAIQMLNSQYLDLLVHAVTKRNPEHSSRILVDIFRLLPKLAEIKKMQKNIIANFSQEAPPDWSMEQRPVMESKEARTREYSLS